MLLGLALLAVPPAMAKEGKIDFSGWRKLAASGEFRLGSMATRRIGFTLGPETQECRVAVAVTAVVEAKTACGYSQDGIALEVNGEVMGLKLEGRSRLLNRPMKFHFGANGERTQVSGVEGTLGLIEPWGSARWTLPVAPSIADWLASSDYAPAGLDDPAQLVIEISDLVQRGAYNYVTVKNEMPQGTLRCLECRVLCDPGEEARCRAAYRALEEKYFGRSALVRESPEGREWAFDMDLAESGYSGSDTMGNLETLDDARLVVKSLVDQGYTALMVSGLHMRYNFTPLWEARILPYMKNIAQAAHEAGLKVIDHYDVPIYFSGGYPFLLAENHLDWTQRDIRYGTPTRVYCINHPEFRNHCFAWARRVQREAVIDAYQIDEVGFHTKNHCGCEHCRRLFTEETGFTLPHEADSPVFGNDGHPLWQLWGLFQKISVQRFKRDFLAEVRRENPAAFFSDYTTSYHSPAMGGGLWHNIFVGYATGKEGVSRFPFHDYRYEIADFKLYKGLADAFAHPSWMLWYPLTASDARFAWGMTQACGTAQWHCSPVADAVRDLLKWPHKMKKFDFEPLTDIALVFSEKSKSASLWTGHWHGMEMLGWGEAMVDANIQYQVLHEIAVTPEALARYRVVILPDLTLIDANCADAFKAYVRSGGTLVLTGETGMVDEERRPRPDFLLGEMMNARFVNVSDGDFEVAPAEGKAFRFDRARMLYGYGNRFLEVRPRAPGRSRTVAHFRRDGVAHPGILETACGKGKIYYVAAFLGLGNLQFGLVDDGQKPIFRTNPDARNFMGSWLRGLLGAKETVAPMDLPDKVIYTAFITKKGPTEIDLHFLNMQDHVPFDDIKGAFLREIKFPRINRPMALRLRRFDVSQATLYSPDTADAVPCRIEKAADGIQVIVPGGAMAMYGLLKVRIQPKGGAR